MSRKPIPEVMKGRLTSFFLSILAPSFRVIPFHSGPPPPLLAVTKDIDFPSRSVLWGSEVKDRGYSYWELVEIWRVTLITYRDDVSRDPMFDISLRSPVEFRL